MGSKIDVNFERRFFKNSYHSYETTFFEIQQGQARSKIGPKIDQKNRVQIRMHLGIDFLGILMDFGSQVWAKLEASWP